MYEFTIYTYTYTLIHIHNKLSLYIYIYITGSLFIAPKESVSSQTWLVISAHGSTSLRPTYIALMPVVVANVSVGTCPFAILGVRGHLFAEDRHLKRPNIIVKKSQSLVFCHVYCGFINPFVVPVVSGKRSCSESTLIITSRWPVTVSSTSSRSMSNFPG